MVLFVIKNMFYFGCHRPSGESELWTNLLTDNIKTMSTLSRNLLLAHAEQGSSFSLIITNTFKK